MVYIDYDEVDMTGRIELDYILFTYYSRKLLRKTREALPKIIGDVFSTFDPSTAPLPFEVKCTHCGARYVYNKRTGIVNCQNCGKSFELKHEKLSEKD